jgi:hypothetical protein
LTGWKKVTDDQYKRLQRAGLSLVPGRRAATSTG